MADWIHKISQLMSAIDTVIDEVRRQLAKLLGIEDPIRILPYRGYGTPNYLLVKGRVLKDEGIKLREQEPSVYENIWNMYKRFATDEVPNARLRIRLGELETETTSNSEGYFNVEIHTEEDLSHEGLWCPVDVSLMSTQADEETVLDQAEVMIVRDNASFGIISDIDDTIVHTAATDLLKMIRIVYMGNAESRTPFDGVSDFYNQLQKGKSREECNPIFYVSSSAWNMYDVFAQFMEMNDIPKGPIFLKDIELSLEKIVNFKHEVHKREQIQPIFERFNRLPFILVGDSGQKDPEIYSLLVQDYPGRVLGIFIRDVVPHNQKRTKEIQGIAEKVRSLGSEFFLFQETYQATQFAAEQGWITTDR
ncbi:DUF2183 domain-containing protein [Oscillatoria sp. CS-180]|uniref:App1 family protein n=1 Tax=Oscillatoria sp. CS-180 TaxID=3021720 RepID=UPI00232C0281|nr:phosphatase domain-containing protein [Oscillatoria sp. CS-180]MDB9524719.1 DUF2183 domain-containing protein [Oscillatoria sp. CS-180]